MDSWKKVNEFQETEKNAVLFFEKSQLTDKKMAQLEIKTQLIGNFFYSL